MLKRGQPGIKPVLIDQLVMIAALNNTPFIHDENEVSLANRGQSMSHHQGCAPLGQVFKGLLNLLFRGGIERACRLIQQQHRGVFQHGTGNRDALPLATRQA